MGTLFSSVARSTRIQNYIKMKAIFVILLLALFAISLSSSSSLVKRQTSRGRDCSKCKDFGGNSNYNCNKQCELCPLCKVFSAKGCNYCKQGTGSCKRKCNSGKSICKKNGCI